MSTRGFFSDFKSSGAVDEVYATGAIVGRGVASDVFMVCVYGLYVLWEIEKRDGGAGLCRVVNGSRVTRHGMSP